MLLNETHRAAVDRLASVEVLPPDAHSAHAVQLTEDVLPPHPNVDDLRGSR